MFTVDKKALPFPEPSQLALSNRRPSFDQTALSETEKAIAVVWAKHLTNVMSSRTIAPTDSFFDLGGHSLIAQHVLLGLRKEFKGINLSLGSLFQNPTLRGFAERIDRLRDPKGLELTAEDVGNETQQTKSYSSDKAELVKRIPTHFPTPKKSAAPKTVFLTGGTGFLGSHIVHQLLTDTTSFKNVIVHVRADSPAAGLERIRNTCKAYGLSCDERVECVTGDLEKPQLGVSKEVWERLAKVTSNDQAVCEMC
jgi:L-aminoadipate-semialdehyde dehydrogenase